MTADNQIAMWAEFDTDMLMSEIPELGDIDLDMLGVKGLEKNNEIPEEITEADEIDIEKKKIKIIFSYKDSTEIINTFIKEINEKYPELLFMVEIDD
jgi:hypothetical protein